MDDDEQLIELVRENNCLFNKKDKDYKNKPRKKRTWDEIGEKLHITGDAAEKRWKTIRESYSRQVRLNKKKSGDGGSQKKQVCRYFDVLNFLADHVKSRKTYGNSANDIHDSMLQETDEENEFADDAVEYLDQPESSTSIEREPHQCRTPSPLPRARPRSTTPTPSTRSNSSRSNVSKSKSELDGSITRIGEIVDRLQDASVQIMSRIASAPAAQENPDSELSYYCRHHQAKMERLSPRGRAELQLIIQQFFFDYESREQ